MVLFLMTEKEIKMEYVMLENTVPVAASADIVVVPNRTEIISSNIDKYVQQYRGFARQTALAIVGLAETLCEADANLTHDEFKIFCSEVGLEIGGSVYKKMKVIGKEKTRFASVMDRLPNTWTTIYQLAKLETHDFVTLTRSNTLTPFMTAQEIPVALGKGKKAAAKTAAANNETPDFTIYASNLTPEEKRELFQKIADLQKTYPFKLNVAQTFKDELVAEQRKLAA